MNRKLALITGGVSGIGLGISLKLAAEYDLALVYASDHHKAQLAKDQLNQMFPQSNISLFSGFLKNYNDCEQLYDKVLNSCKQSPEVLINSLGRLKDGMYLGSNFADHVELINEHVIVTMGLTHLCLKSMYKQKFGRIINLSSISARYAKRGQVNYATSKSAIEGFTRSLALEVAHRGVTVNAIAPGLIETPMTIDHLQQIAQRGEKIKSKIPVGHVGSPQDIGSFAAFLCSKEAGYITGQVHTIDGGRSLGDSKS